MAQFIFWNWEDDDATKHLNHRSLGITEPGVYRGFDADLTFSGGTQIRLHHSATGFDVTMFDEPTFTVEKRGVILTKQGVIVHENGEITIPFTPNATGNPRIDLIYLEHQYVDVQNGSTGIYNVELGAPSATPVAPTLLFPQIKIVIGQLYVPGGANLATDAGVVWTPSNVPSPANDPTIVRTFGDQSITGVKRLESILQTVKEALVVGNTIDLQGKKANDYYLMSAGSAIYLQITDFVNLPVAEEGFRFRMKCGQKIELVTGSSLITINGGSLFIEAGEEIEVWDAWGLLGIAPATHVLFVSRGGEANKSMPSKFRSVVSFSQGAQLAAAAQLTLPKTGNSYEVVGGASWTLDGISNHHPSEFFLTPPVHFGGTEIKLKLRTSPIGGNVTIRHNQTVANKKIYTPTGASIIVKDGAIVTFIEYPDRYEISSVVDSENNVFTIAENLLQFMNYVLPETWKVIGGGGTFDSGGAVPNYNAGTTAYSSYQPPRIRKEKDRVFIEGAMETVLASGIAFTPFGSLPLGHRPLVNTVRAMRLFDSVTNDAYDAVIVVNAGTGGVLVFASQLPGTSITLNYIFDLNFSVL
ncbi:MAG: hypothetical protein EKK63_12720 [Acinetobacter sp.]|uniref:hypothetical protein n=1 Tax=Acinetobacter sp. TaxID=472 RepID=UPI000F9603B1|nr:hypothetical protein [Acinetobacter sp.]RUP38237.1 MAG: hypothetical protein EKK63_12720 [Acinetobacter sp.]